MLGTVPLGLAVGLLVGRRPPLEVLSESGTFGYLVLLVALGGSVVAALLAARAARPDAGDGRALVLFPSLLTMVVAAAGVAWGVKVLGSAVGSVEPASRAALLAMGASEVLGTEQLGLAFSVAACGCALLARVRERRGCCGWWACWCWAERCC